MAAQLYSNTQLAQALYEVLQELVQDGKVPEELAVQTLDQVSHAPCCAGKILPALSCKHLPACFCWHAVMDDGLSAGPGKGRFMPVAVADCSGVLQQNMPARSIRWCWLSTQCMPCMHSSENV